MPNLDNVLSDSTPDEIVDALKRQFQRSTCVYIAHALLLSIKPKEDDN